ncbi:MAG: energy-coupling factor ABC transporter ATP-binding protein [Spirochaetes bacterium]|nr:energy-coupling factor ABC transporter ATP-binding protein [Spirochaetota bacterium]
MPLFTLKNVNFNNIIKFPDIEIPENISTFICGESGCGKSTLLKLLNGVISSTDGEINYLGKNIEDFEPISLRRDVLLVGQTTYLFDKTIKDNFDEYYAYRGQSPISEKAMESFLDICSVNLPLGSLCNTLSGGEQQRVFIAINLSFQPRVLMMDEPTSALDDKNAAALMKNIKSFCKDNGITLIVVSHDKAIADKYADNIISLQGRAEGGGEVLAGGAKYE